VLDDQREFRVLGSGVVYVVDGRSMTYSNAAEEEPVAPAMFGFALHVLSSGDCFNLETRKPVKELPRP
jgi:cyanophycinase